MKNRHAHPLSILLATLLFGWLSPASAVPNAARGIEQKIVKSLYVDDVAPDYIEPGPSACLIVPTKAAPQPVLIAEGDGVAQSVGVGDPISLEYVEDTPGLDTTALDEGVYVQRFGIGSFDIVSLSGNETLTDDEVLAMFEFVNITDIEITQFSGGYTWVTYTCDEPCDLQADFDADGDVDTADLLVFNANLGCLGDLDVCEADLNGDGITNVADWLIFLTEFGRSCDDDEPVKDEPCDLQADFDADGDVDTADLLVFNADLGCLGAPDVCEADLNGDGITNITDWLIFLTEFGRSCDDDEPVSPVQEPPRVETKASRTRR